MDIRIDQIMNVKTLAILFTAGILFTACTQETALEEQGGQGLEQERLKLKNAAFCACMGQGSMLMKKAMEDDGSVAGYVELSDYGMDAFDAVFKAASVYADTVYRSKYDKSLTVMKCLDFYNSSELQKLVEKYDSDLVAE